MAPKRSSSTAGRPAKAQKKEPAAAKCKEIAEALEIAQQKDVPAEVTSLLASTLKYCLPLYKEERHEFQNSILDMVAKTLGNSEAALQDEVVSAEATVNGGDEEQKRREAAVVETAATLEVTKKTHEEKAALKAEKADAFKASFAPLKEAQQKQKEGDAEALKLEKTKAALESAVTELLTPMTEAGGSKRQVQSLVKQLGPIELEDSMMSALELPLLKKPDQRGSFDAVILEQLSLQLAEKKAVLEKKLAEEAPAREQRAEAVKAAQDNHDAAKVASETAASELNEAKEGESAAKSAAATAEHAVGSLTAELRAAAKKLDAARKELEGFRSGPLASFQELLERTAPAPEPEEPAEAAPAEAAPAEAAPAEEPKATEMSAQ